MIGQSYLKSNKQKNPKKGKKVINVPNNCGSRPHTSFIIVSQSQTKLCFSFETQTKKYKRQQYFQNVHMMSWFSIYKIQI